MKGTYAIATSVTGERTFAAACECGVPPVPHFRQANNDAERLTFESVSALLQYVEEHAIRLGADNLDVSLRDAERFAFYVVDLATGERV